MSTVDEALHELLTMAGEVTVFIIVSPANNGSVRDAVVSDRSPITGWSLLTDRERLIADLVGQAMTNQQIGRQIFISPHTVNYHLRQIYRKLNIGSRVRLAQIVRDSGASSGPSRSIFCP